MRLSIKARIIRRSTNTQSLEITARKVSRVLAQGKIPSWIAGGFAIQEYGYARTTNDIDIIVPNVKEAFDYLSIRGFKPKPDSSMTLTALYTKVEVDLLPGGGSVG